MNTSELKLTVLVATYGRPAYLQRCIHSLLIQSRLPDQIVIVTRRDDEATEDVVKSILAGGHDGVVLEHAQVSEPGVLEANRAGMKLVCGDIVCFIDDDAAARPDWLSRIETWFHKEPRLGALGGRDIQHGNQPAAVKRTRTVGRIHWYGRIVGNHEKEFRGSCYVEHIKGVNMAFRTKLLPSFDRLILGNAHHYETDLCFAVRHRGYRVRHDGELLVDHFVDAPRHLDGFKPGQDAEREYYIHYNRVYVMLKNLGAGRRGVFLFYAFVLDGAHDVFLTVTGKKGTSAEILRATFRGRAAGVRDYLGSGL